MLFLPLASVSIVSAAVQLSPLVVMVACYYKRSRTLSGTARAVPGWRQACFYCGVAVIGVALSGLGALSEQLLYMHMLEHLLIGDIASLLLVLGLTGPLLQPLLAIRFFDRLRFLVHPAVAMPL
ncbi:MAG TPA: cytochrome c oxidase assembly protein, partial [Solirubrobacteraceae bacterium]|nr:cytochrome c oxidase assembly protein [Solirubrobacteraceae bacterium]